MRAARRAAIVLLCGSTLPGAAIAADEPGAKLGAAAACARIAADAERLRCFDGLFGGPRDPAPNHDSEFGLSEAQKQASNPQPAEEAEPDDLTSRLTRVIPRGFEPPVLELENGQQWRLLESLANVRFRAGDPVVIRRSSWGSYLVSNPERNGAWRVRRIR